MPAADDDRARRAREAARRAVFGDPDDGAAVSADERDETDRARSARGGDDGDRRYLDERPPHHDQA